MVAVEDRSPQGRGYSDFAGDTPASAAVDLMHHSLLLPAPGTTAGPRAAYDDCLAAGVRYKGARYSETIKRRFGKMPGVVKFQLTNHARKAVAERQIPIEWIERTLVDCSRPERPNDPTLFSTNCLSFAPARLVRYLAAIPAMSLAPVAPFLNLANECFESR
jgi:hypothetical protein